MNKWKLITIGIIIAIAWFSGCKYGSTLNSLPAVVIDTSVIKKEKSIEYTPVIKETKESKAVILTKKDNSWVKAEKSKDQIKLIDTVYLEADIPQWLLDIAIDYDLGRVYDTTLKIGNTTIHIEDVVNQNKLLPRNLKIVSTDTTITKSITEKATKKYVGSVLFSLGSTAKGNVAPGFGFQIKDPLDRSYQINYTQVLGLTKPIISVGLGIPLRLSNKTKK